MKNTKKLTLSAVMVAMGTVFMAIGAYVEALDLTTVALASLLMVFVYIEIGSPYTWLVWLCTTLASALMYFGSPIWVEYFLVFGIYPVIKGYIERLPRSIWLLLKLIYANLTFAALALGLEFVLKIPFLAENEDFFGLPTYAVYIIIGIVLNIAFVAYDFFINVMVRYYMQRLRSRFKSLLK